MDLVCGETGQSFIVRPEDLEFLAMIAPVYNGKRFDIPPPRLCPDARHRRRLAWRNERNLYRTECAVSAKPIISSYSPDRPYKVCTRERWLEIDNRQSGRDFDFSRPFFPQFAELYRETFKANVMQGGNMQNSEYTHFTGWLKNCYLLFDSGKCEDCMYCALTAYSKNCLDGLHLHYSELCYDCVKIENCYSSFKTYFSKNCSFSAFLYDCIGCNHCIGCVNLRNKEYCVFNEFVGKSAFDAHWEALCAGDYQHWQDLQIKFDRFLAAQPRRACFLIDSNASSGDNQVKCENVHECFDISQSRNCAYCYDLFINCENCYDVTCFGEGMTQCYELTASGGALGKTAVSSSLFGVYIYYGGFNIVYSHSCHENSRDLFGCADLRKAQYCILNKQYSKTEFEDLAARIAAHMQNTGEWGEFFPMQLSPYGYNQSLAQEEYPLTRNEALKRDLPWSDYTAPLPKVEGTIEAAQLPLTIKAVDDGILRQSVRCTATGRPFRILPEELEFYRNLGIPLPRLHPEERQHLRLQRRNPRRLSQTRCTGCRRNIMTSHDPRRVDKILCEDCFVKELY